MERYYIANGDKVISCNKSTNKYKATCGNIDTATRFKYNEGLNFIEKTLHSDMEWGVQKFFSSSSKKNYIITNATNFVGVGGTITNLFANAKSFRSVADAEAYIKNHRDIKKVFSNAYIINDKFDKFDMSEKKEFTDEQLAIIGVTKKPSTRKIFSKASRMKIYDKSKHRCCICGKPIEYIDMTIDHIIPLSRGGKNTPDNLRCVCEECNKFKGNMLDAEMYKGFVNMCAAKIAEDPDDVLWDSLIRAKVRGTIKKHKG